MQLALAAKRVAVLGIKTEDKVGAAGSPRNAKRACSHFGMERIRAASNGYNA
jgi:hypothetical protein